MKNEKFKILLYLKKSSPNKSGKTPIMERINEAYNLLLERKQQFSATDVKELFQGSAENQMTLLKLSQREIDDLKSRIGINHAPTTMSTYLYTHRSLTEFIKSKFNASDLAFGQLNEQFIRDYQEFCEQTIGLSNQTVRHYLALLKEICHIAFKEGYSEKYYFCHFKLPKQMDIDNTQYIIVRHHDTANEHLHIVYNRIDNNLKLISINNDYKRNIATCKKLKDRHNLTYGKGKEHVNRPKLNGADKTKYEIYDAMKLAIPKSHNITELSDNLKPYGIMLCLKCRRNSNH